MEQNLIDIYDLIEHAIDNAFEGQMSILRVVMIVSINNFVKGMDTSPNLKHEKSKLICMAS